MHEAHTFISFFLSNKIIYSEFIPIFDSPHSQRTPSTQIIELFLLKMIVYSSKAIRSVTKSKSLVIVLPEGIGVAY